MSLVDEAPTLTVFEDGRQEWRLDGLLHRIDGPAIIRADGSQIWWVDGRLHRIDGPAYIGADGHQEWWANGLLHRVDGPAVIRADGSQYWWISDRDLTKEIVHWRELRGISWPWDEETQMMFLLTFG